MKLAQFKQVVEISGAILTTLSIMIGGIWTLREYVWKREAFPWMETSQTAYSALVSSKRLVHVALTLENKGSSIIKSQYAWVDLRQVLPWTGTANWPKIEHMAQNLSDIEIEPNEKQSLYFDFLIDPGIQVVAIESFIQNPTKRLSGGKDMGWGELTIFEIPRQKPD